MDDDLRKRHADAVLFEYRFDRSAHLTLSRKEIVLLASGAEVKVNARSGQIIYAVEIDIAQKRRAHILDLALVRLEDFLDMLQVFFIGNAYDDRWIRIFAALVDKDLDRGVVRNADIPAVVDKLGVADPAQCRAIRRS